MSNTEQKALATFSRLFQQNIELIKKDTDIKAEVEKLREENKQLKEE
ncbi:26875_t:CDS:1, partial [Dentiscutata erythropus]